MPGGRIGCIIVIGALVGCDAPAVSGPFDQGVDAALPDFSQADLSSPDLAPWPRTLTCAGVVNCYAGLAGGAERCRDQGCFDRCNAMALLDQYAVDATAYYVCGTKAYSSVCLNPCQLPPPGGSTAECRTCLFGSCTKVNGQLSCGGGQCSIQYATCANDR